MYVRPNTLLALGACETRPDYDYRRGVELHLFAPDDGNRAVCDIPNIDGGIEMTVGAVREGNRITFDFDKTAENSVIVLHGVDAKSAQGGAINADDGIIKIMPEKDSNSVTVIIDDRA